MQQTRKQGENFKKEIAGRWRATDRLKGYSEDKIENS